ncbi:MAG: DEAD/DEAH box helicase [Alphaproteobacteria bacterium]
MNNFNELGLSSVLELSLEQMKYDKPTPIQAQAIPLALKGRDILGSAQTGTGKTAAFSIPMIEHLLKNEKSCGLVMTPTRELGKQVMDTMRQLLGPKSSIKTAFLIGGEPINKQIAQLQRRPRLIVGTPGRITDHMKRGTLHVDRTDFLVLDETDRMLDMGFSIQIDVIVKDIPKKRQTLLFSATMPKNILSMADKYQNNPERIAVGNSFNPAKNIQQDIIRVDSSKKKYKELTRELDDRRGSIIVFVKTKRNADEMAKKLQRDGYKADAIHGDLRQSRRDRVIRDYRQEKFLILVATDVVARGLDVPHVEHVINYDLPQMPEDYIHRIGRTARAGRSGRALCIISPVDGRKWSDIERLMYPDQYKDQERPSGGERKRRPSKNPYDKSRAKGAGQKFKAKKGGKPFKEREEREDRPSRGAPKKRRDERDERPSRDAPKKRREGSWEDRPSRSAPKRRNEEQQGEKPSRSQAWKEKNRAERSDDRPSRGAPKKRHDERDDRPSRSSERRDSAKPKASFVKGKNPKRKPSDFDGDAPIKRKKPKSARVNKDKGKPKRKDKKVSTS